MASLSSRAETKSFERVTKAFNILSSIFEYFINKSKEPLTGNGRVNNLPIINIINRSFVIITRQIDKNTIIIFGK